MTMAAVVGGKGNRPIGQLDSPLARLRTMPINYMGGGLHRRRAYVLVIGRTAHGQELQQAASGVLLSAQGGR